MQNPGIFRAEVYSELWDTRNPVKHLGLGHCAKIVNR